MPYSLIQAADQGNGILFSQLMTFGRYSLNIQPPEEIRLLSSYDDTVHVSENIAPRFQTNIYAEANNALVNSMGIGVFIPDYTIEHSVGTIQYEFSHSVYVDEDGNIVETMTPDYPPEIDWQKHREDKKLDYGFYEGYETYDETSFAGHYDISKVLFQGTIPPNPIETRLLGQTGAAQWQGGKAIINGIEIQANDFPELAPGGQYANEDVYLNIYSVADIFAGNCDGVSPWTGDVYDHGEDSRIMASPMDTECYNRWTLSSTWTFYGKEDPRCIISCGDPQYPSKLAWENDYVLSNALYGYSPIKGEKTAGEEANTKYSTVDMIPAKNYNSSLEALSAIMNDEDGELHIVDRCTELVQQMEGDF